MPYINVNIDVDKEVDIDVEEFFHQCSNTEKKELKELLSDKKIGDATLIKNKLVLMYNAKNRADFEIEFDSLLSYLDPSIRDSIKCLI